MKDPETPTPPASFSLAEDLLAEFVRRRRAGEAVEIDDLCKQNPEAARRLRDLHQQWLQLGEAFEPPPGAQQVHGLLQVLTDRSSGPPRYRPEEEIGRGGMGTVMRVYDQDLRRTLAMKVARGPGEEPPPLRSLGRFLEEAQITGQLDHPGIVPVHELGLDAQGRLFFTMRLVKGRNLEEIFAQVWRSQDGWTVTRALGVLLRVCEALAYAHSKGVLHRDLKPANIMVGRFGETYVMDWGLAKLLQDEAPAPKQGPTADSSDVQTSVRGGESPLLTQQGDVIGTPAYMSPEQAAGDLEQLDGQSDVYAVGAMMYQLLARRRPYNDPDSSQDPRAILDQVRHGPPTLLRNLPHSVPAELDAICAKAMERDKRRRYPSILAMAEDLRAFLEQRVVHAYASGAAAEFKKWLARNKSLATVLTVALLVVGGLAGSLYQQAQESRALSRERDRSNHSAELAAQERHRAEELATQAQNSEQKARRLRYLSNIVAADHSIRLAQSQQAIGRSPHGEVHAAQLRLKDCEPEHRGFEWYYLQERADSAQAYYQAKRPIEDLLADPTGRRVLVALQEEQGVQLLQLPDLQFLRDVTEEEARAMAWTADGSTAAMVLASGLLWLGDPEAESPDLTMSLAPLQVSALAFHPDGELLAMATFGGEIHVLDLLLGELHLLTDQKDLRISHLTFLVTPAGEDYIAALYRHGGLSLWDSLDGELFVYHPAPFPRVEQLALARDGSFWACSDRLQMVLLDVSTGRELHRLSTGDEIHRIALSADAEYIATSHECSVSLWSTAELNEPALFEGHTREVESLSLAGNPPLLLAAAEDGSVRRFPLSHQPSSIELQGHLSGVERVAFHPSGISLASSSRDGELFLWDLRQGEILATPRVQGPALVDLGFTADGEMLVTASREGRVHFWNAADGAAIETRPKTLPELKCMAVSPTEPWIATGGSDQALRVLSFDGSTVPAGMLAKEGIERLAFLPDGQRVVAGLEDGSLELFDLKQQRSVWHQRVHLDQVQGLAVSPDGQRILSGSEDETTRVLDAKTGAVLLRLDGDNNDIETVAISADGSRYWTGAKDRACRLWDAASGDQLLKLTDHSSSIRALATSPDGRRVVVAYDSTIQIYAPAFED